MRWSVWAWGALCLGLVWGCGGGQKGPPRKQTFKVTGKVAVDGEAPAAPVQISCIPAAGMDEKTPTYSATETKPDGTFEIATYQQGDGVPEGDYLLTFSSREMNVMKGQYTGPDKLKERYSDPKKSDIKFTVKDKPVDLGEIKLTTK